MITRDVASLRVVHGVDFDQYDASCGGLLGATSTALHAAGRIIDRLGLGRNFGSVLVHVGAYADLGTSTLDPVYAKVGAWLYHSSTTCAEDFDRYSSEDEKALQALFVIGNTDTCAATAPGYMATATSTGAVGGSSGGYTATATDAAAGDYWAAYELSAANRYLRPYLVALVAASSSGGTVMSAYLDLIFGDADQAPPLTTSTGPLVKTT